MPAYPNVAVLGPIASNEHGHWFFAYSTADIGCIQHKSAKPYSTEQEAELALEQMQVDFNNSGHIVYHARTQEDRDSTVAFIGAVTEYVSAGNDDDEE